jgi:hypothetical protein
MARPLSTEDQLQVLTGSPVGRRDVMPLSSRASVWIIARNMDHTCPESQASKRTCPHLNRTIVHLSLDHQLLVKSEVLRPHQSTHDHLSRIGRMTCELEHHRGVVRPRIEGFPRAAKRPKP